MEGHKRDACHGANPGHVLRTPYAPPHVAENTEQHREHEDEPVLRLIHSAVSPGNPDYAPVVERTRDEHREHDSNKTTEVRQALK